jgi:hypothetical protein
MPMKSVQFIHGQIINILLYLIYREKMTADIQMHSSPCKLRLIFNFHGGIFLVLYIVQKSESMSEEPENTPVCIRAYMNIWRDFNGIFFFFCSSLKGQRMENTNELHFFFFPYVSVKNLPKYFESILF